ncbi:MAG: M15 family metallopeptidase [Spirochaetales bacterium]|jgi:peptidoglycan L-alanyl-D-glutamate endopeptidase CwlK|nr:M15 family metallopeptidase [Spirochaetales bacterium]
MNRFYLGTTSKERLSTCHQKLQFIVEDAIKTSTIDFGVVCGFRGAEAQQEAFNGGKSKARWGESLHNFRQGDTPCSLAVDLAPYSARINNYIWDDKSLWDILYYKIMITAYKFGVNIKWGGNFESFTDKPHFQIEI